MEVESVDAFLVYLARVRERTDRLVGLIPADRFDWRPEPGAFSFGDLLRHVAALERYMFAENLMGRQSRYPGHGRELAAGAEEVTSFWSRCRSESLSIYERLTDEDLDRPVTTPAGVRLRGWKWLRALIEHEVHHRGQLYLMLRMIGVATPPLFDLTSEDVARRSLPSGRAVDE